MANQKWWHCLSSMVECDLLKDPPVLIKIRCSVLKALSKMTKGPSCVCTTSLLYSSHDSATPRVLLLLSLRVLSLLPPPAESVLTFLCHMMCAHPFLVLGFHAVKSWSVTPFDFTVLFLCNIKNWCETSMSCSYCKGTERASVTAASSNINTVRKRICSLHGFLK